MLVSLKQPVRVRDAAESDRAFLLWLDEEVMRDHAIALWGEWRPREAGRPLTEGCSFVMDGVSAIGRVALEVNPDCLWLDRLHLLPSHQRQGIGAAILHDVMRSRVAGSSGAVERTGPKLPPCASIFAMA